jgi:glutamate carboxypeptidase
VVSIVHHLKLHQLCGASDGNFAAAAGAQVLDGLGAVGDGAHAAHESVDISTLEDRSKLLNALIKDLLND